jgi:aminomethyltransferase
LAYVPTSATKLGTELAVQIRGRSVPAVVMKRPFYQNNAQTMIETVN